MISVICGLCIGFYCGFMGLGGGMMMLFILTFVLGYDLKTAVGTSVFVMTFTAFTGAASHFYFGELTGGMVPALFLCAAFTPVSYTHLDVYKRQERRKCSTFRRSSMRWERAHTAP